MKKQFYYLKKLTTIICKQVSTTPNDIKNF